MNIKLAKPRKKMTVAIGAALIMAMNNKLGLGIDPVTMKYMAVTVGSFLIGQGAADWGKGATEEAKS